MCRHSASWRRSSLWQPVDHRDVNCGHKLVNSDTLKRDTSLCAWETEPCCVVVFIRCLWAQRVVLKGGGDVESSLTPNTVKCDVLLSSCFFISFFLAVELILQEDPRDYPFFIFYFFYVENIVSQLKVKAITRFHLFSFIVMISCVRTPRGQFITCSNSLWFSFQILMMRFYGSTLLPRRDTRETWGIKPLSASSTRRWASLWPRSAHNDKSLI